MATATDYMPNYQGNAGLGVGGGSASVLPDASTLEPLQRALENHFAANVQAQQERFKILADTTKTISLLDQEFNTKMWVQKINDRDTALKAFMDGSASVKDYLPQDETYLKSARKQYDDAYTEWSKNINNPDATKKFKQAQDNLSDIAGRLALRSKYKEDQETAAAGMANPDDISGMNKNLSGWLNGKDENGKPAIPTVWQKYKNFNEDEFNKQAVVTTTNLQSKDGLYTVPFSRFDYNKTVEAIRGAEKETGNPSTVANAYQMHYFNDLMPVADQQKKIKAINDAINEHNASVTDPNNKVPELGVVNINGRYQITDDPANYAAKYLLAQNPDKSGTPVVNEGMVKVMTEKEKERHDKAIEGIDLTKARNQAVLNNAKIKALQDANEDINPYLQNQYRDNILNQENLTDDKVQANSSIPITTFADGKVKLLTPIGGTPIWDNPNPKDPSKPLDPSKAKVVGYKGGYYDRSFISPDGTRKTVNDLANDYTDWVQANVKKGLDISSAPSFDDWLKNGVQKGNLKAILIGQNGQTTEDLYIETQKAINNSFTKKGQNPVISSLIAAPDETGNDQQDNSNDNQ